MKELKKIFLIILGLFFITVGESGAAVRCQLRLGAGCNGPVVYQIQLCAVVTFSQGTCVDLCRNAKPICNITDFDEWVSAYRQKGRNGFSGPLAESGVADEFDQSGQLAFTSGNMYSVCISEKTNSVGTYSSPSLARAPRQCGTAVVPGPDTCTGGTVFNNDPTNPQCITQDSYCGGGGSTGNFGTTILAGQQLVAVQNEHFVNAAAVDPNLNQGAAIAGTSLTGLVAPVAPSGGKNSTAQPFASSNPKGRGSPANVGATSGSGVSAGSGASGLSGPGSDSALASKNFAMEGAEYKGNGAAGSGGSGSSGSGGGLSWFGNGNSAATAGGATSELEIGAGGDASRGLASEGRLQIEDPENYFMLSDVDVSLFKRVTAQCRKKERALVLAP